MYNVADTGPQQGNPALANRLRAAMAKSRQKQPGGRQVHMPDQRHDQRALAFARGELDTHRRIESHIAAKAADHAARKQAVIDWAKLELDNLEAGFVSATQTMLAHDEVELIAQAEARHEADRRALDEARATATDNRPGNDFRVIEHKPIATAYDRKRRIWRDLETQKADLEMKRVRTPLEEKRLALLPGQIAKARAEAFREATRTQTPEDKKRQRVDGWRAGNGRAEYNATRRKVRQSANADLSDLTPAEREDRKAEQRYVSNTRARLMKQGLPESEIENRIQAGLEKRRAKSSQQAIAP